MSERLPTRTEREPLPREPEVARAPERRKVSREHIKRDTVETIRSTVAEEAQRVAETSSRDTRKSEAAPRMYINRAVKKQAYQRTMKDVRQHMSKTESAFSRVIHNDAVERLSDVGSQTVARPSALIGGGLFALVGIAIVNLYARRNGFSLSGYEFLLLSIIGMLAGVSVEFFVRFVRRLLSR